jgi:hypothetical protein
MILDQLIYFIQVIDDTTPIIDSFELLDYTIDIRGKR